MLARGSTSLTTSASRPVGVTTSTRSGSGGSFRGTLSRLWLDIFIGRHWRARENTAQIPERLADDECFSRYSELPQRSIQARPPVLECRNSTAYLTLMFVISINENAVGEIIHIEFALDLGRQCAPLVHDEKRSHVRCVQIGEEFMKMQPKELFVGHRAQVSGQSIDDDEFDACLNRPVDSGVEFARRKLRGIERFHAHSVGFDMRYELCAHGIELQGSQALIKEEDRCLAALVGGVKHILKGCG